MGLERITAAELEKEVRMTVAQAVDIIRGLKKELEKTQRKLNLATNTLQRLAENTGWRDDGRRFAEGEIAARVECAREALRHLGDVQ